MNILIRLGIRLDRQTYVKIKDFSKRNNISLSEIIRVLVENSPLEIKTRNNKKIQRDAKEKNLVNTTASMILVTKKVKDKLTNMCSKNEASYSEVVRTLINKTRFKPSDFKTINEIQSTSAKHRAKRKRKNIN